MVIITFRKANTAATRIAPVFHRRPSRRASAYSSCRSPMSGSTTSLTVRSSHQRDAHARSRLPGNGMGLTTMREHQQCDDGNKRELGIPGGPAEPSAVECRQIWDVHI